MKKLFLLSFLSAFTFGFSQRLADPHFYLDSNFAFTGTANYQYIRVIKDFHKKLPKYTVTEFYRTGEPYSIGEVRDVKALTKTGEWTYYYKNRHPMINMQFDGEPTGYYQAWYENGNQKLEALHLPKNADPEILDRLQIQNYWHSDGKLMVNNGNGKYVDESKQMPCSGNIRNGLRDSIWNGKIIPLKATFTETYSQGKLVTGVSTDSLGAQHRYVFTEMAAQPIEGFTAYWTYLKNNLKFSKKVPDGRILVSFIIEPDGSMSNIKILRDLGYGSAGEVLRVLSGGPRWIPRQIRGIGLQQTFGLPITVGNGMTRQSDFERSISNQTGEDWINQSTPHFRTFRPFNNL